MSYFSDSEINEAKKRVREMQNKASKYIEGEAPSTAPKNNKRPKSNIPVIENSETKSTEKAEEDDDSNDSFLIILALILLLSKEDADQMLILALLYLLL